MCSVRQSPSPSAPNLTANLTSSGVSALARTESCLSWSAQANSCPNSPVSSGGVTSTLPLITSPVLPLIDMASPSLMVVPLTVNCLFLASTWTSEQPATVGIPKPRATSAAWEVIPPLSVRTPLEASIPAKSSGLVSERTKIIS